MFVVSLGKDITPIHSDSTDAEIDQAENIVMMVECSGMAFELQTETWNSAIADIAKHRYKSRDGASRLVDGRIVRRRSAFPRCSVATAARSGCSSGGM